MTEMLFYLVFCALSALKAVAAETSSLHEKDRPYFDSRVSENVSTVAGREVNLDCRIRQLNGETVSWIRKSDLSILSLNSESFTSDARFQLKHSEDSGDFTLRITRVMTSDTGLYECQISSIVPKLTWLVSLTVKVPQAEISGGRHQYFKPDSRLQLNCHLATLADPPVSLSWLKNGQLLKVGMFRDGGLGIESERTARGSSTRLVVAGASSRDTGNYTCQPSEGIAAWVNVHVIDDDLPEAMQAAVSSHYQGFYSFFVCIVCTITVNNYLF